MTNYIITQFITNNQFSRDLYLDNIRSIEQDDLQGVRDLWFIENFTVFGREIILLKCLINYLSKSNVPYSGFSYCRDSSACLNHFQSEYFLKQYSSLKNIDLLEDLKTQIENHTKLILCRKTCFKSDKVPTIEYLTFNEAVALLKDPRTYIKISNSFISLKYGDGDSILGIILPIVFAELSDSNLIVPASKSYDNNTFYPATKFDEILVKNNKVKLKARINSL